MKQLRTYLIAGLLLVMAGQLKAQNATSKYPTVYSIIAALKTENEHVYSTPCVDGKGTIISDRGLNYFFATKIAGYLAQEGDISLFKNYAVLNSADGEASINWNFTPKGEGRTRHLTTLGFKAKIEDGFASIFSNNEFNSDLGITLKHTLFGRGSVYFDRCVGHQSKEKMEKLANLPRTQKAKMNSKRALIVHTLELELLDKDIAFEKTLYKMVSKEVPGEDIDSLKKDLRAEYYEELGKEYVKKYAEKEAEALAEDSMYNLLTTWWVTFSGFIPVTSQKINIAPAYEASFGEETLYPWEAGVSYNKIWESRRYGRFFFFLNGSIFYNNSVKTKSVEETTLQDYKRLGGIDTVHFAELESKKAYVGAYDQFITPQLKAQGVWFPKKSPIGFSALLEKNFGQYDPLNGRLGVPIRFTDKDGKPTVNVELQLRASDLTKEIDKEKSFGKRLAFGFSVGLPFSSIIY